MSDLIIYKKAIDLISNHTKIIKSISIRVQDCLGYYLAGDIRATSDLPRFNASAADGYGVKISDIKNASEKNPIKLKLIGEVKAGGFTKRVLNPGETFRIMTGAPIPPGVEAVIMKEFTVVKGKYVEFSNSIKAGENIRPKGGEFKQGQKILSKNTLITPQVIGILASLGIKKVKVFRKPKVAVLVTGDELVQPGKKLQYGKIYDSNSLSLITALQKINIESINLGIARDRKSDLLNKIKSGLQKSYILIVSGGISVGEYDYVQEIFDELKIQKIFWRIAIKPGKPTYFGVKGKKLVFGLPGNPVATLVIFNQLVKPAIKKIMGEKKHQPVFMKAVLEQDLRKHTNRLELVRGIFKVDTDGQIKVRATKGQDSHMLGGMIEANCLIYFPKEISKLSKNELVKIEVMNN